MTIKMDVFKMIKTDVIKNRIQMPLKIQNKCHKKYIDYEKL